MFHGLNLVTGIAIYISELIQKSFERVTEIKEIWW